MKRGHILAIPYPAQGHVIPIMELCLCLTKQGFEITFVNTENNHERVMSAMAENDDDDDDDDHKVINMVSLPDGMEALEDRNDLGKLTEAVSKVMPIKLEELINQINGLNWNNEINCVIADLNHGWALEVAEKLGIRGVAFWSASAGLLASIFNIPKLIHDKIIDFDGTLLKSQEIELAPSVPTIRTENLVWASIGDKDTTKILFQLCLRNIRAIKIANHILCNSSHHLEPEIFNSSPQILPIGPLLATNRLEIGNSSGHFWSEDPTCLEWLHRQTPRSVIYVAFGSFTVLDKTQFKELALGLEISGKPFLWVVRPDIMGENPDHHSYPDGFLDRVGSRGKIVGWAPQQRVLKHPSIGCFMSHCGWNSVLEGVGNGVPFLCWPYFADQFFNEGYVCDIWEVGLRLKKDDGCGIVKRMEIKDKVERVFGDEELKVRVWELKKRVMEGVGEGGGSCDNFKDFIEWLKS